MRTFVGSMPRLFERSFTKLLIIRPVPIKRISAKPICAATIALRARCFPAASMPVRPDSLSDVAKSTFDVASAGAVPNSRPVRMETSAVKPSTRKSVVTPRGMVPGASEARISRRPTHPSPTPRVPPAVERSTLSVSNCRITRTRPAPRADRTATSVRRAGPRASCRPATFAHAINSTKATAPWRT